MRGEKRGRRGIRAFQEGGTGWGRDMVDTGEKSENQVFKSDYGSIRGNIFSPPTWATAQNYTNESYVRARLPPVRRSSCAQKKPASSSSTQPKPVVPAPSVPSVQSAKKRAGLKSKARGKGRRGGHVLGGADYVTLLTGGRRKAAEEAKMIMT